METTLEAPPPASKAYYVKSGSVIVGGSLRTQGECVTVGEGGDLSPGAYDGVKHLLTETPPAIEEPAGTKDTEAVSQSDAEARAMYAGLAARVAELEKRFNALAAAPKKAPAKKTTTRKTTAKG